MCTTLKYVHLDNDFDLHSLNDIGGVMVSVLASSAVDRRYESRSGQTKDVWYLLLSMHQMCIKYQYVFKGGGGYFFIQTA